MRYDLCKAIEYETAEWWNLMSWRYHLAPRYQGPFDDTDPGLSDLHYAVMAREMGNSREHWRKVMYARALAVRESGEG